jgi:hypothetical protein
VLLPREERASRALQDLLVKVRDVVASEAACGGFLGHEVSVPRRPRRQHLYTPIQTRTRTHTRRSASTAPPLAACA